MDKRKKIIKLIGSFILVSFIFFLNFNTTFLSPVFPNSKNTVDYPLIIGHGEGKGEVSSSRGVTQDKEGNVYVVDEGNSRISVFDKNGKFLRMFGGRGISGFQFLSPYGITIDREGYIYVTDCSQESTFSLKVSKFKSDGTFIKCFGLDDLKLPLGIKAGFKDKIFIVDAQDSLIKAYSKDGEKLYEFGQDILNRPINISIFQSTIYVVDQREKSVFLFNEFGGFFKKISLDFLKSPWSIFVKDENRIYILDNDEDELTIVNSDGKVLEKFGKPQTFLYFDSIDSLTVDTNGDIYVTDTYKNHLQKFSAGFELLWRIYDPYKDERALAQPSSTTKFKNGLIAVCDTENHAIKFFNLEGDLKKIQKRINNLPEIYISSKIIKEGVWGYLGSFINPVVIKEGQDGTIYIGDYGYFEYFYNIYTGKFEPVFFFRLLILDPYFFIISQRFNKDVMPHADDFEIKPDGDILLVNSIKGLMLIPKDREKPIKILNEGKEETFAGIALGESGNIFIVSTASHTVSKFDMSGNKIVQKGSFGNGPGQLNLPYGVFLDTDENVYVLDSGNSRISIFDKNLNFKESFGNFLDKETQFVYPFRGIALEDKKIVVVDKFQEVLKIFENKKMVGRIGGFKVLPELLEYPVQASVFKDMIYILDGYEGRMKVFSKDGEFLFGFGMSISYAYIYSLSKRFSFTPSFSISQEGFIYVVSTYEDLIYIFKANGNLERVINLVKYNIKDPTSIFVRENGDIYLADSGTKKVFMFNRDFKLKNSFSLLEDTSIYYKEIFIDEKENVLWVLDCVNQLVIKSKLDGKIELIYEFPQNQYINHPNPSSIFVKDGIMYLLNSTDGKIMIYDKNFNLSKTFGEFGGPSSHYEDLEDLSHYKKEWNKFLFPNNIFIKNNLIYLTDTSNNRVIVFPESFLFEKIEKPKIVSPLSGSTQNEIFFSLKWEAVKNAKFYDIEISYNKDFLTSLYFKSESNSLKFPVEFIKNKQIVYWKVRAVSSSGVSDYSISNFKFDIPSPTITLNLKDNQTVYKEIFILEGKTLSYNEVYINDKKVNLSKDGSFKENLYLKKGENLIKVIVVDPAKNKIEITRKIFYYPKIIIKLQIGSNIMYINDIKKELDAPPIIFEGRTFVPIRVIVEAFNGEVLWNSQDKSIKIKVKDISITLWIGKSDALVNGVLKKIDPDNPKITPIIKNSRTLIPVRFISLNLKASVEWDSKTQTVIIEYIDY